MRLLGWMAPTPPATGTYNDNDSNNNDNNNNERSGIDGKR